jgi:hypothetical protein
MDSPPSTPGPSRRLTGWGVEVCFPGRRRWHLLTKPGREEPLSTHMAGAREWVEDYRRRGCKARMVEVDAPRGPSCRERPAPPPVIVTLPLFEY